MRLKKRRVCVCLCVCVCVCVLYVQCRSYLPPLFCCHSSRAPWRPWHSFLGFLSHESVGPSCHCLRESQGAHQEEGRGERQGWGGEGWRAGEREWQGHCCRNPTGTFGASNFKTLRLRNSSPGERERERERASSPARGSLAGSPRPPLRCHMQGGKKKKSWLCTPTHQPCMCEQNSDWLEEIGSCLERS